MIISAVSLMLTSMVVVAGGQKDSNGLSSADFTTEFQELPAITLGSNSSFIYTITTDHTIPSLSILLCQSNVSDGGIINFSNSWKVSDAFSDVCVSVDVRFCPPGASVISANRPIQSYLGLGSANSLSAQQLENFFFCVTSDKATCDSYSNTFNVATAGGEALPMENVQTPTGPIQLPTSTNKPIVSLLQHPTATVSDGSQSAPTTPSSPNASASQSVTTSFAVTVSATPSTVTVPEPTATADSVSSSGSSSGKSKLSTGAIVGIALGALVFVAFLALALIFLCFRRRRHRRERLASGVPEQVMLTRSPHDPHSQSRDLLTEKETGHTLIHPNSNDSNFRQTLVHPNSNDSNFTDHDPNNAGILPIQRHSALSPYDSTPSAPYSGPAASPPRRKPTPATVASAVSRLSRNISSSNANPPSSPHNINSPSSAYESYHDNDTSSEDAQPRYGDARHSPQIFSGTLQAPFLSEPGMSAEEVARLDEEERRIDAAIAAAEARNGNGR